MVVIPEGNGCILFLLSSPGIPIAPGASFLSPLCLVPPLSFIVVIPEGNGRIPFLLSSPGIPIAPGASFLSAWSRLSHSWL
jgi:hypothetical protein